MAKRSIFLILTLFYSFSINPCYSETDTLLQGQELKDWDYLISSNKVFTLKFFGFKSTISPYLGIFYNPERITHYDRGRYDSNSNDREKAVWVANRNNPSRDIYGKLIIDIHGKLSILSVLDLFIPPTKVTINASATLLDTGNFVLQELNPDGSVKRVLWQSFDYPTDTLLPGMKLGINLKTGHQWSLTSWRTEYLPDDGSFTLTGDPNRTGQIVILRGGKIHWRSGAWQINGGFKNAELQYSGPDVRLHYVSNDAEQSFTYLTKNYDLSPALTMNLDGRLNSSTLYRSMVNFEPHSTFGLASRLDIQCLSKSDPVSGCAEYDFKASGYVITCYLDVMVPPRMPPRMAP